MVRRWRATVNDAVPRSPRAEREGVATGSDRGESPLTRSLRLRPLPRKRARWNGRRRKRKGRDCSRPLLFLLRSPQFEARFGGEAGHDLISVS